MRRQRLGDEWNEFLTILGGLFLAIIFAIFLFGCDSKVENKELGESIDIKWGHYAKEFVLSDGTPCVYISRQNSNNFGFGPALSCGWGMKK